MEHILCSDRVNINPNAAREYRPWKTTFENFIKECQVKNLKKLC